MGGSLVYPCDLLDKEQKDEDEHGLLTSERLEELERRGEERSSGASVAVGKTKTRRSVGPCFQRALAHQNNSMV